MGGQPISAALPAYMTTNLTRIQLGGALAANSASGASMLMTNLTYFPFALAPAQIAAISSGNPGACVPFTAPVIPLATCPTVASHAVGFSGGAPVYSGPQSAQDAWSVAAGVGVTAGPGASAVLPGTVAGIVNLTAAGSSIYFHGPEVSALTVQVSFALLSQPAFGSTSTSYTVYSPIFLFANNATGTFLSLHYYGLYTYTTGTPPRICAALNTADLSSTTLTACFPSPSLNVWTSVAVVVDYEGDMVLYVNGVQQQYVTSTAPYVPDRWLSVAYNVAQLGGTFPAGAVSSTGASYSSPYPSPLRMAVANFSSYPYALPAGEVLRLAMGDSSACPAAAPPPLVTASTPSPPLAYAPPPPGGLPVLQACAALVTHRLTAALPLSDSGSSASPWVVTSSGGANVSGGAIQFPGAGESVTLSAAPGTGPLFGGTSASGLTLYLTVLVNAPPPAGYQALLASATAPNGAYLTL